MAEKIYTNILPQFMCVILQIFCRLFWFPVFTCLSNRPISCSVGFWLMYHRYFWPEDISGWIKKKKHSGSLSWIKLLFQIFSKYFQVDFNNSLFRVCLVKKKPQNIFSPPKILFYQKPLLDISNQISTIVNPRARRKIVAKNGMLKGLLFPWHRYCIHF